MVNLCVAVVKVKITSVLTDCGFITEILCCYCSVRTESLNITRRLIFVFEVPWPRRLVAGATPRSSGFDRRSVLVRLVVDKLVLGKVFLRVYRFSSFSNIQPLLHTILHVHVAFTRTNGRSLVTFQKSMLFRKFRSTG